MPRTKKTPDATPAGPQLVRKHARTPSPPPAEPTLRTRIEERAYQLFLEGGGTHGNHLEHWLAAERELMGVVSPEVTRPQIAGRGGRTRQ